MSSVYTCFSGFNFLIFLDSHILSLSLGKIVIDFSIWVEVHASFLFNLIRYLTILFMELQ